MSKIVSIVSFHTIAVGPRSTVLPDGTIVDPAPYNGAAISFDDGVAVVVARPINVAKVAAAYRAEVLRLAATVDGVSTGTIIT